MKIGAKNGEVGDFLSCRENNGERSSKLFGMKSGVKDGVDVAFLSFREDDSANATSSTPRIKMFIYNI